VRYERMCVKSWWNDANRETLKYWEDKPAPWQLCPPKMHPPPPPPPKWPNPKPGSSSLSLDLLNITLYADFYNRSHKNFYLQNL